MSSHELGLTVDLIGSTNPDDGSTLKNVLQHIFRGVNIEVVDVALSHAQNGHVSEQLLRGTLPDAYFVQLQYPYNTPENIDTVAYLRNQAGMETPIIAITTETQRDTSDLITAGANFVIIKEPETYVSSLKIVADSFLPTPHAA